MKLFLYLPENNGFGERLTRFSATLRTEGPAIRMRTLRQLKSRLGKPLNDRDVIVVYLPSLQHLEEILPIAPLLERIRVIAILPDADPKSIALGHQLRPRFLTTAEQRFENVAAVLKKMGEAGHPAPR